MRSRMDALETVRHPSPDGKHPWTVRAARLLLTRRWEPASQSSQM